MTLHLTIKQQLLSWLIATGLVTIGAVAYILLVQLPTVKANRITIDLHRAAVVVAEQRANNLEDVSKQLTDVTSQQQALDAEIWKFSDEEHFFELWADLARKAGVNIADPVVTDATPSAQPVARGVSVTVTGSLNNVLAAITSIQQLQPSLAIKAIIFSPSTISGQTVAQIDATSLWH